MSKESVPGYARYAPGELSRMKIELRSLLMADKSFVYPLISNVQCCRKYRLFNIFLLRSN
jgi:hypothetical protein